MEKKQNMGGTLLILLAGTFWGSMGLFTRPLNGYGLSALHLVFLRLGLGALLFALLLLLRDRAGLRIALVSTVGIATIAASINAGGLGAILFDGLRTMNTAKILWGSLLSAVLAVGIDRLLILLEKKA